MIVDLLKKNIVMVPVVASLVVGTFTGVRYGKAPQTYNNASGALQGARKPSLLARP